jgi:hypothetical protein
MTDWSNAIDNLYSNFVLRDILSFIFPGAIVCISLSILINPDYNRLLFVSDIIPLFLLLGVFYLVGFSIQIIREFIEQFKFMERIPNSINLIFNRNTWAFHNRLMNTYKKMGQFNIRSDQILERFTVFYQFFGNSCIALIIALICFVLNNLFLEPKKPISGVIFFLLILLVVLSYVGFVIHEHRRDIWISTILNKNDRLKQLFFELRDEKKIINKKIDLVETQRTPNFQGLNIFGLLKLIRYNPVFFKCLSRYDDNIIRFVLLHEAGHIESGSLYRIENLLAIIVLLVIITGAIVWIFFNGILQLIVLLFSMAILVAIVCLIIKSFLERMKNDEFKADKYAFRKMQENYDFGAPCELIENIFCAMNSLEKEPVCKEIWKGILEGDQVKELLMKYSGLDKGYHPTNEDRANRLKEIVSCE